MNRPGHQHHQVVKHWACYDWKPSVILVWGWVHDPHFFPKTHKRLPSGHILIWTPTKSQHSSVNNQYHYLIISTKTAIIQISFVVYSRRRRSIFLFIIFLIILLFILFLIFFFILFLIFFFILFLIFFLVLFIFFLVFFLFLLIFFSSFSSFFISSILSSFLLKVTFWVVFIWISLWTSLVSKGH